MLINYLPQCIYRKVEKYRRKKAISKIETFGIQISAIDECVILANGPSLTDSLQGKTLDFIKQRKKFCVNNFPLTKEFFELKPDYIAFMDPLFWSKDVVESCFSDFTRIAKILSTVDWKLKIFMPRWASEWNFFIDVPLKNSNVEIIYVNTQPSTYIDEKIKFLEYKQNLSMPIVQNVIIACIYLAINSGFKKAYLFGADHSWHESVCLGEGNRVLFKNAHFYDIKPRHTPVWTDPQHTKIETMSNFFQSIATVFKIHEELERYAEHMESKIYNASKISYIDAYERV